MKILIKLSLAATLACALPVWACTPEEATIKREQLAKEVSRLTEQNPEKAKEIIHQFINNIFAPLFFVSIGLKINFFTNFDIWLVLAIIVISFAGKIIGSGYGALRSGYTKSDALAVGFGMNARGAMEIILGLIALENGLIDEKLFVALVVMALVTSMTSGPLMKWALKKKAAT